MAKRKNKYIRKRKKKRLILKLILFIILISSGFAVFACKSDFFTIKKVAILGNPARSGDEVKEKTKFLLGQNILFIDKSHIVEQAKKNPYVNDVKITKAYPKLLNITISEKKAVFYIEEKDKIYVLSNELVILENNADIKNRNLVRLNGVKLVNKNLGEKVVKDDRLSNILVLFAKMIDVNPTNYKIDSIDIGDLMNIKVYIGQIEGRLGNDENLTDKMNRLLHIIEDSSIGIKKGYVDVGFDGNPVYYKE